MNDAPKYPSLQSRERLEKLSIEFKPDDVKFLLTLNSNISIEECRENAMESIQSLKGYVESNHSTGKYDDLKLISVRRSKI